MIELLATATIPSQNVRDRRHWRADHREVKRWTKFFIFTKRAGGMDDAKGMRKVYITSFRTQRCKDIANLVGGCKSLIDGLVHAKLLVDDSTKWAEFVYHQEVASKSPTGKPCTTINIVDVP